MFTIHFLLLVICYTIANESNYFIDQHSNCNNIYGAVEDPNQSTEYVIFLGKKGTTKDCYKACLDVSNSSYRCESYTFLTRAFGGGYADHCYGRFNYPLWTPINQQYVNCGRIIWNCEDDRDCSLNGKCNKTSGNCTCNNQWHGYKCGYLKLDVINDTSGYIITSTSSWGGSVISSNHNDETNMTKYDIVRNK